MKYIELNGIRFPLIGFGCYKIGEHQNLFNNEIETLEFGFKNYNMNLLDTAEMYGDGRSEKLLSNFITKHNRDELIIIDKILPENAEKGLYIESCKKSLERLNVDYIDVYLLHWRANVNLQDMVDNMEKLVSLGYIRNWGVSNFDVKDMEDLFKCKNGNHCIINQCLYNLLNRGPEVDLIPWCEKHNVIFMAYSPIGHDNEHKIPFVNSATLKNLSYKNNVSIESLLLRFVIRNENVITVFKTSSVEHLISNMNHVFEKINENDLSTIDKIFPKPLCKVKLKKI